MTDSDLLASIQHELDALVFAARRDLGWGVMTALVHDTLFKVAQRYADSMGFGFGPEKDNVTREKTIIVFAKDSGHYNEFMFDQCWLCIYCNPDETDVFPETDDEPRCGYIASCALAAETEWHGLTDDAIESDSFYKDFRKLIIARAKVKLFVFRCDGEKRHRETISRLRAYIVGFSGQSSEEERYLISCLRGDTGRFVHGVFDPTGMEIDLGRLPSAGST
jgi:hypothetical protein